LDLHELGYSYGEIATQLGCFADYPDGGRNAVIGAMYRARERNPDCMRPKQSAPKEPAPESVLAAAIVMDAFEEAMNETGLSLAEVQHALRLARRRERWEARNAS
jgi:hypothetical protein